MGGVLVSCCLSDIDSPVSVWTVLVEAQDLEIGFWGFEKAKNQQDVEFLSFYFVEWKGKVHR